ncbi:HSP20-like chaperone [Phellopilus nigrolimitatus]|nr:HSP20-like chaperone [Phellopilus nigrolimitatus]
MSSVYYYEPFFSFNDFRHLFDDALSSRTPSNVQRSQRDANQPQSLARGYQPRMDIHESPESNVVTATLELPGLKKEEVAIDVQKGRLVISGEQTLAKDIDEKAFIIRERQTGRFSRTLPLPAGTQASEIKASMENGILSITFPKSSPEQAPQRITVA